MKNLALNNRFTAPKNNLYGFSPRRGRALILAGAVVTVVCFGLMAFFDQATVRYFQALGQAYPTFNQIFHAITTLGNSALYLVPCLLSYLLLRWAEKRCDDPKRRARLARIAGVCLFLFVAVALSGLVNDFFKILLGRPRPKLLFQHGQYAFAFFQTTATMWFFPSGHANSIFALATALNQVTRRKALGIAYFAVAILVAASRVVICDHYPSDVLMGGYIGILTTVWLQGWLLRRGSRLFPLHASDVGK